MSDAKPQSDESAISVVRFVGQFVGPFDELTIVEDADTGRRLTVAAGVQVKLVAEEEAGGRPSPSASYESHTEAP